MPPAACPPEGDHPHRYLFTVFAVKADRLDVKADTSAAVVGFNLHFNTLAKAEIMLPPSASGTSVHPTKFASRASTHFPSASFRKIVSV